MEKIIKLNVSGKKYQITLETLNNIPYLANGFDFCNDNVSEPIFIQRSPLVFDHVLAYVIDKKHPFPIEYLYELDFYDIKYDIIKLHDPHSKKLDRINNILDILYNQKVYGNGECPECNEVVSFNEISCYYHVREHCNEIGCLEKTPDNYCNLHVKDEKICNVKNCANFRMLNEVFCFYHLK
jgi:hypothetical protein